MTSLTQRLEGLIGKDTTIGTPTINASINGYLDAVRKDVPALSHSILEDVLAIVGEDEPYMRDDLKTNEPDVLARNELRAKQRAALTAYCIGEGGKTDATRQLSQ